MFGDNSVITRIIKAMLLAALVSFCLMNSSVVHAKGDNRGWDRKDDNRGWNRKGGNDGGSRTGGNSGYEAPELNPAALAGGVAFLAAILLLEGHRRKEPKSEPDQLEHEL
jgi:hypothetical protein